VAVSAGFAPVMGMSMGFDSRPALGSETDGSIVCPSGHAALYGIKPTVGLVSRAGVIPISHNQDTVLHRCCTLTIGRSNDEINL
jgi:Asp-tRNA(Asn)/Glu-tRNA(Gln) amidotransferase A subunit family amidase